MTRFRESISWLGDILIAVSDECPRATFVFGVFARIGQNVALCIVLGFVAIVGGGMSLGIWFEQGGDPIVLYGAWFGIALNFLILITVADALVSLEA